MKLIDDLKLQYRIGGVAQKLIFWNVGLFGLPYLINVLFWIFNIDFNSFEYLSLSSNPVDLLWKPWTIIGYAFFHQGFFHILFNMMVLNFSSRLFLTYFTSKQLLSLYFVGAIFVGIIYILCYFLFPSLAFVKATMVGASGAIMAILLATATYSPLMEIKLMFLGVVKLWHIVFVLLVLDLVQLPLENTGGHIAHLAGALYGFVFMRQLQNGTDIGKWFTDLIDKTVNLFKKRQSKPFKKIYRNTVPTIVSTNLNNITQKQIDDILDKIFKSGYDSLSTTEKEFLLKAGK